MHAGTSFSKCPNHSSVEDKWKDDFQASRENPLEDCYELLKLLCNLLQKGWRTTKDDRGNFGTKYFMLRAHKNVKGR